MSSVPASRFTPADCNGVIRGPPGGTLDMARLGTSASAAVWLANPGAVEPVPVKTDLDGTCNDFSIGFARAESGITSQDDMQGRTFAFADPNATWGYLVPLAELPAKGFPMTGGAFLGAIVFAGGHGRSIIGVADGDVDAAVAWADGYNSGAFRRASDPGLVDMNDLVEIRRARPIPEGPASSARPCPGTCAPPPWRACRPCTRPTRPAPMAPRRATPRASPPSRRRLRDDHLHPPRADELTAAAQPSGPDHAGARSLFRCRAGWPRQPRRAGAARSGRTTSRSPGGGGCVPACSPPCSCWPSSAASA